MIMMIIIMISCTSSSSNSSISSIYCCYCFFIGLVRLLLWFCQYLVQLYIQLKGIYMIGYNRFTSTPHHYDISRQINIHLQKCILILPGVSDRFS